MNRSIFQIWKSNNLNISFYYFKKLFFFSKKKQKEKEQTEITFYNKYMCCRHSFEKPNNLKEIYNSWDVFID
jgi:hypothetical protein